MAVSPFRISAPQRSAVAVALEPVQNALNSLALLNAADQLTDLAPWVIQTAAALSPQRRHRNRLVFEGLGAALTTEGRWDDLPAYLDELEAHDANALRDRVPQHLHRQLLAKGPQAGFDLPEAQDLLADRRIFLTSLDRLSPEAPIDRELQSEAHALLANPPVMKEHIIAHLREMWAEELATEWGRAAPKLRTQAQTLSYRLNPETPIAEAFRAFTGRDLPADVQAATAEAQRVVFVPSPHVGPYVTGLYRETMAHLFFTVPRNVGGLMRTSPIGRAELLARLNALGDETRLHILALLTQHDDLYAQEIMARLALSQSSASRHLNGLRNAGYLLERRGEGANKRYSLNPTALDLTFQALTRFLSGSEAPEAAAQDERASYPQELQRFLDARGRVTAWPAKEKSRLVVLDYLASLFAPDRPYTEADVNALLVQHLPPHVLDHVNARRALCDYRFLRRERDGSRYWRETSYESL